MIMVTNRFAFFIIAMASSIVAVSAVVGSAYAVKKIIDDTVSNRLVQSNDTDNSNPQMTTNAGGSSRDTGKTNTVSAKALEALLRCEMNAATNGHLKLSEVRDCYLQAFTLY
jgi:hypothetical protein